jgi:immune inhibitor A
LVAPRYYIAEYRQYRAYDQGLRTGPYVFGSFAPREDLVEHFPYHDGLLITYWDTQQSNNYASQHAGEGRILQIDAHPQPFTRTQLPMGGGLWNFAIWRNCVQSYDSTFGLEANGPDQPSLRRNATWCSQRSGLRGSGRHSAEPDDAMSILDRIPIIAGGTRV